ncbi:MAG TPA: serine/threonine-protein kinase, partial [Planctomycetota bacterium]|nr:serine/threonine-protein kinase [Planctomycetota bacterium]
MMSNDSRPQNKRRSPEGPDEVDPVEVLEAEAVWTFKERLLSGESPDPDELLDAFPGRKPEFEKMLAILQWGKLVLSPPGSADAGPCREGVIIGDYRICREIGRGGMGVVYEAEQLSLKRQVALKVLPRVLGLESEWLRRFQREASMAAVLHHTNIVPIHDFGTDQGVAYYSMELISGPSLHKILTELRVMGGPPATLQHVRLLGGPVDGDANALDMVGVAGAGPQEAVSTKLAACAYARKIAWLLGGVAEGLHLAHQKGIVHRDVKPANLMLSSSG